MDELLQRLAKLDRETHIPEIVFGALFPSLHYWPYRSLRGRRLHAYIMAVVLLRAVWATFGRPWWNQTLDDVKQLNERLGHKPSDDELKAHIRGEL
jgi:hypothetical protein